MISPELPLELPDKMTASSSDPQLDWDAMGDDFEGWLAPSHMQASVMEMATVLEEWLGNAEGSEDVNLADKLEERSDVSSPDPVEEEQPGMSPPVTHHAHILNQRISTI